MQQDVQWGWGSMTRPSHRTFRAKLAAYQEATDASRNVLGSAHGIPKERVDEVHFCKDLVPHLHIGWVLRSPAELIQNVLAYELRKRGVGAIFAGDTKRTR